MVSMSSHDPASSFRVGDREREAATERLTKHAAAGRLTYDELEQRLEQAQAAVFASDLAVLEADLPTNRRVPARRRPAFPALAALVAAVVVSVLVGHPIPPLFILAVVLWVRARRSGPWSPRHRPAPA
jgi:ferric-dicitrate binding protein FerR (iron transport regulator)